MREFRARAPRTDDALYRRVFRKPLTTEEIINRAERKKESSSLYILRWCSIVAVVILVGITEPVHTWLRAHLQFLWGALVGSLLQVPGWLRDRWRWLRWFSWQ